MQAITPAELGALGRGVTVIGHPHPLRTDIVRAEAPAGLTLAELLPNAHLRVFVTVNDVEIPRGVWGHFRPRAGSRVTVRALPAGDDAKKIARTIAQIAVTYFSFGLGALWGSVVAVVGNLAINALIPPQLPEIDAGASSFNRKQSITGTRNQANPFGVIPRIYGLHRYYPPYAANPFTETLGENQYLRVLLQLGYGPLNISDIRIGSTPIAGFEEVEYEIGAAPALFAQDVEEEALALALDDAEDSWTRNTGLAADEISLDLMWPQGLFSVDEEEGGTRWAKVNYFIEYRPAGSGGAWSNAKDADGFQISSAFGALDGTEIQVTGKARETRRLGIRWMVSPDEYEVRVTRKATARHADSGSGANNLLADSVWVALRTIRHEAPSTVPGTLLMAMRIRATDQLNGVTDRINMLAESVLPVWDGEDWVPTATSNPAWVFVDIACGSATERSLDKDTRFHLDELLDWADACTAKGLEYNAVIDSPTTVHQLMRDVAAVGRASFANRDGQYTVVRDLPDLAPVQHFTPRNSWGFRGSRTFSDVPHALRVKFVNPDADWQQDERIVYADGYHAGNATKFEVLQTRGVTDAGQAWREGRYHLAVAANRSELFTWNADVEHIRCTRGDLVRLAHDVIEAGLGFGRIKGVDVDGGGLATKLYLDERLTMEGGTDYAVRIRRSDGTTVVQQVTTVAGEVTELTPTVAIADLAGGELFQFGELGSESLALKVTRIDPGPNLTAQITGVLEAPAVLAADAGDPPAWTSSAGTVIDRELVPAPAPIVDEVRSDHRITARDTGGVYLPGIYLRVQPNRDVIRYEVRYRFDDMPDGWTYQIFEAGTGTIALPQLEMNQYYDIHVRAIPRIGLPSAWVEVQHQLIGTSEAPPAPTSPVAERMADGIRFKVTLPENMPSDWWLVVERAPDAAGAPGTWAFRDKVQGSTYVDRDTGGGKFWYRSYLVNFLGLASAVTAQVTETAKVVEDGAGANVPSMVGVKKNKNTFTGASNGWAYLHGFAAGDKADVDGELYFDDAIVAVTKGAIRAQVANRSGYIVFEPAAGTPFTVGGSGKKWAFAWRINGQWTYDNGTSTTNFTPSDTMVVIGQIRTGASSIKRAVAWSVAMELDTLPEAAATVGARAGTDILNASGGVVLGDADIITSQGTSLNTANVDSVSAATARQGAVRANAGLDAAGDLARNITTGRRDSSNLLGRTGGGAFTGELNADLTSTHTAADTTAVNGVPSATVQSGAARATAGLDASGDLNRNITTARRNSSNLLGRSGGGDFTGELDATLGDPYGSQNLLGRDAGPEVVSTSAYLYSGFAAGTSGKLIASIGLGVGDTVSFSAEVRSTVADQTNQRLRIRFRDSGGTLISSHDGSYVSGATTYTLSKAEGIIVPVGTVYLQVESTQGANGTGVLYTRRAQLNRGPRVSLFTEPPFRAARETADDLSDGTTYGRVANDAVNSSRQVDLSLAGVVNRTLANIADTGSRFAAVEANANRTETRTAADTTAVNGVAAVTVQSGAARATAGLDASGDLNRNITTARRNSSNLLGRSGGGDFTGDLAATLGDPFGSQNLMGRDAGPEHTGTSYEYLGFGTGLSGKPLAELGMSVGDVLSFSALVKSTVADQTNQRIAASFYDAGGTLISSHNGTLISNSATWTLSSLENLTIPANSVYLRIRQLLSAAGTGTVSVRQVQLNRGPKVSLFTEPPIRPNRETADDLTESASRRWAAETGANITESRTAADTAAVNGVAAATVQSGAARATAGLDASGDLKRNITTARRNSSNLLGRSGGGDFTGDLAADVTRNAAAAVLGLITETWEAQSLDNWPTVSSGGSTDTFHQSGVAGGYVLRAAGGGCRREWSRNIPYDPAKLYRLRARVRLTVAPSVSTTDNVYIGVTGVAADGVTRINTTGANSTSAQHYLAANSLNMGAFTLGEWQEVTGYFSGLSAAPFNSATNPLNPTPLYTGVAYFRPLMLLNWSGGDGTTEIDFIGVDVIDATSIYPNQSALPDGGGRFSAVEANANRTETRTSADTTAVNGVPAATVQSGAARATAGLDASGDLARNITTGRRDSSNLLGRTGGGSFTGELNADLTSTHTAADTTAVNGVAAATVQAGAANGTGLVTAGSGVRTADQRNHAAVNVTGLGSVQSAVPLTFYSTGAVDVNAHTNRLGGVDISISAVTNAVTGLSVGNTRWIAADDPTYAGGTLSYSAFTSAYAANNTNNRYVPGYGTVPGGGSSGGGAGDDCVAASMWLLADLQAKDAEPGQVLDGYPDPFVRIRYAAHMEQPCVEVITEGGAQLVCSVSTPFELRDGSCLLAPAMYGQEVQTIRTRGPRWLVRLLTALKLDTSRFHVRRWERVVDVVDRGLQAVVRIGVGGQSYAAGADPMYRVISHNPQKP
jgi:hypothetical protein